MSQYPSIPPFQQQPGAGGGSPYQMGYGFPSYDDGLGPARSAGIMLFVIGGIGILLSLCLAGVGAMLQQVLEKSPELREQMAGISPDVLRILFLVFAGCGVVLSIVMIVLGAFVRRGGLISAVIAIVLSSLIALYFVGNMIVTMVQSRGAGGQQAITGGCIGIIALILLGVQIFLLVKAIRAIRANKNWHQMWQYQQMQQAYGQQAGGYGYPQQNPPPPPSPSVGPPQPPQA